MNFVKSTEVKPKATFSVLLYGPTGIGKTTAALSAPSPVAHVDFDGGVTRVDAKFTPNALIAQIDAWEGYAAMVQALAAVPAKSIVIDTVGKELDMIQAYMLALPKYAEKKMTKPSLQVYGDIRVDFVGFNRGLKASGKNVIYIAQEVETTVKNTRGEDIRYHQPACGSDKNKTEILQDLDLVGRFFMEGDKTYITFDPSESHYAKNTCNLPHIIEVPRCESSDQNILLSWIFDQYIAQQQKNLDMAPYYEQVSELSSMVGRIDCADKANKFCEYANTIGWLLDAKAKVMAAFNDRIKALQLKYNEKTTSYE